MQTMLHDHQREMQHELRRRIGQAPSDRSGDGLDEGEQAEAGIQAHIEVALIQMREGTLQRIREALVRLDGGEYGYCAEREGEIAAKRLRALPFAIRCTACEESHEQREARERRTGLPHGFGSFFADLLGV
jgi:DnaK suppressor protein